MKIHAEKNEVRSFLKEKRNALSQERREEARIDLYTSLSYLLKSFRSVLSFHSFMHEIDTSLLNAHLAAEKKLLLPRVAGDSLLIYAVADLDTQVTQEVYSFGKLKEPIPALCIQVDLNCIDCILVPGLGFDHCKRRIGYGKGHYDRFLAQYNQLQFSPQTIGLGFKEQLFENSLPHETHDLALDKVLFF